MHKQLNNPLPVFALTCHEAAQELSLRYGKGIFHAAALYREIFKKGNLDFAKGKDFLASPSLTKKLKKDIVFPTGSIVHTQEGDATKFATQLFDKQIIESVVIVAKQRKTLCVSSQVGCKMGCTFCETGSHGFVRNLSTEEIVFQVFTTLFTLKHSISNIVFMGMGEPLDNFENVFQAIRVISDPQGLNISHSHITISTAGIVDSIRQLSVHNMPRLRLAVSINAADNATRNSIMPINKKNSLQDIKDALKEYPLGKKGVFLIEYVLLAGINDSHDMAKKLAEYVNDIPVRVNLIAYNTNESLPYISPTQLQVQQFRNWLVEEHVFVRIRQSRGTTIQAACGQLWSTLSVIETGMEKNNI